MVGGGEQRISQALVIQPDPLPDPQTPPRLGPSQQSPAEGHVLSPLPGRAVSFPLTHRGEGGAVRGPPEIRNPTRTAVSLLLDIPNPHQVSGLVLRQP